ncbi:multidrug resistance-associated protein 1-like [Physella acuta]|uniref:multidrug resistance-associated protein 1-like n=1 Tax=Physella acuta TaxID=109671 RepID=UPI0027DC745D|nr:multidrug resistance-associated protein 1-like [Physella acuta]XP_059177500.1 multidrug resistance-associated protein 1-like [Physella acuta]
MRPFCKDSLWDSNLTWNNTWPQLTNCFQSVILTPLPCYYLVVFLPFYSFFIWRKPNIRYPFREHIFVLKQVCCFLLLICETATCVLYIRDESGTISDIFSSALKMFSFMLVILTALLEHRRPVYQSPWLLMFYGLMLFTNLVPFYSKIIQQEYSSQMILFVLFYIKYGIAVCSTILFSWNHRELTGKTFSAEEKASIISRIFFHWTSGLVLHGYKKPLMEDDICPLNENETSIHVVSKFLQTLSFHTEKLNKSTPLDVASSRYDKTDIELDQHETPSLLASNNQEQFAETNLDVFNQEKVVVKLATKSETAGNKRLGILMWKIILHTFSTHLIKCGVLAVVCKSFLLICPVFMRLLIEFTANEDKTDWHGYLLATALFTSLVISLLSYEYYLYQNNLFAIKVRAAIMSSVYRKSLSLSSESRQVTSAGEITQLLSKDIDTIWTLCSEGFILMESPFELTVGLIMLYYTVGLAMLSGLATLAGLFILKSLMTRLQTKCEIKLRAAADERMKITSQVFTGIKVLKLYAWEEAFQTLLSNIRNKELKAIFRFDLLKFFITFAWSGAVFWVIFFTFLTHVMIDESHHLKASTVFVAMAYFTAVRRASNCIASVIDFIIGGLVAGQRVMKFLLLSEIEKSSTNDTSELSPDVAIKISDGHFSWSADCEPTLKNINLEITKGSLVAVVGVVGCGKSSLLSALLGEMITIKGNVLKQGKVAYTPQEAWVQNDSLQNNILFDSGMREEEYRETLRACALEDDLKVLPSGDLTEIGEKGINLSGGQKQRVSLARAIYQKSEIYFLDDPLSAVDSHVGRHIFDHVIGRNGLLKDKTRIFVTHGIQWLPEMDKIIVMTNGQCTEQGTLDQLISHNGPFAQFLSEYLSNHKSHQPMIPLGAGDSIEKTTVIDENLENEAVTKSMFERLLSIESYVSDTSDNLTSENHFTSVESLTDDMKQTTEDSAKSAGDKARKLIQEEEMASGRVSWSVYTSFAKAMGYFSIFSLGLFFASCFAFDTAAGFWLSSWVDSPVLNNVSLPADSPERQNENSYFIGIYSIWGILQAAVLIIFTAIKAYRHRHLSHMIHQHLMASVLASPIQFFDTTPIGRLLARFSKDISVIDTTLLLWIEVWLHSVFSVICSLVAIAISIPAFLAVTIPIVILYYLIEKMYLPTSSQLRRLDRKWLSPILSHVSESFAGTSVIRALGEEDRFIRQAENKVDFYHRMTVASYACERWLSIHLGFLSSILVLFAGILAVKYRYDLSPGLIGLCLTMGLTITSNMQLQVRMASLLEMDIVSLERILQYIGLPSEAPQHLECPGHFPEWPLSGTITFKNVSLQYRAGLEPVLKNLSFHILDGEKIGVVGRTGAGKSSLMLALFRLVEPCDGKIIIDGVDVSKLGLYDLRQKLTILPQDPVLFSGSLRSNLDPLRMFSDIEIWTTLELCHLKQFFGKVKEGLDFQVGEGGGNLSAGQRQLVCLGRALLRKTKILVLDEATAAVDVETDELIQKTIRSEFQGCTVLTIAHRLNTVMDYDRILVLDDGQVVELDTPTALMNNVNSSFHKMVTDSHNLQILNKKQEFVQM